LNPSVGCATVCPDSIFIDGIIGATIKESRTGPHLTGLDWDFSDMRTITTMPPLRGTTTLFLVVGAASQGRRRRGEAATTSDATSNAIAIAFWSLVMLLVAVCCYRRRAVMRRFLGVEPGSDVAAVDVAAVLHTDDYELTAVELQELEELEAREAREAREAKEAGQQPGLVDQRRSQRRFEEDSSNTLSSNSGTTEMARSGPIHGATTSEV
jgi:hypothetical protein